MTDGYGGDDDEGLSLDQHAALLRRLDRWDRDLAHWDQWEEEAELCFAMRDGEQWTPEEREKMNDLLRVPVVINRIAPMVDAVSGAEIQNRQEVRFYPREMGDSALNETLTAAAEWVRDECDAADEESDAFLDAITCGIGWIETRMDYDADPEGMPVMTRIDPLEVKADPAAKKRNMVDRRYHRWRRSYTREAWEERFPDHPFKAGLKEGAGSEASFAGDDYRMGASGDSPQQGVAWVDFYQWFDLETVWRVADPATGEVIELSDDQWMSLSEGLEVRGLPPLPAARMRQRVYRQAFRCGQMVLEYGDIPDGHFTLECITGKRDRNKRSWYGMVRAMIDPQKWSNKFFSTIIHIVGSNAKGGVMAERDAVDDPEQFEESYARADHITWVESGALRDGRIQNKPMAPYPAGLDRLLQVATAGVADASGVNKEMLGVSDRQQAGVLEHQRKQAAYGLLSVYFDSLKRYRRTQGRQLLKLITEYMSDGRLVRVLGKDGLARYVPLLRQQGVAKFDVIVDEAPSGPQQRERVWAMVTQMMPILRGAPAQLWASLVQYSPLPTSLAQEIAQILTQPQQPDPQAQAMQAQGAQAQMASLGAKAQSDQARAAKDAADAQIKQLEALALQAGIMRGPTPNVNVIT